jgi:hypothetical protein
LATAATTRMTIESDGDLVIANDLMVNTPTKGTTGASLTVEHASSGNVGFELRNTSASSSAAMFNAKNSSTNTIFTIGGNGITELSVNSAASCGVGNVCSGDFTPTYSNFVNIITGPPNISHIRGMFLRVGDKVQVTLIVNANIDVANTNTAFEIDEASLPFGPTFATPADCQGIMTNLNATPSENYPGIIDANTANSTCRVRWKPVTDDNTAVQMVFMYDL